MIRFFKKKTGYTARLTYSTAVRNIWTMVIWAAVGFGLIRVHHGFWPTPERQIRLGFRFPSPPLLLSLRV